MADQIKPGNIARNIANIANNKPAKKDTPEVKKETNAVSKEKEVTKKEEPVKTESSIFKGFSSNITTVPKSDVSLPITNITIRQSPIIYGEEVAMAQTAIKEEDIFMETLKLLYKHIVEGPELITKSFDSFLDNVVEYDINALLYGFFLISYGPEVENVNRTLICKECGGERKLTKINLIDLYEEKAFDGDEFEAIKKEKELKFDDCDMPGVSFYFVFPTLSKSVKNSNIAKNNALKEIINTNISNFMTRFTINNGEKEYSDKESVINAIETLSVKARKKIKKFLEDNFFDYGIKLKYKWTCENMIDDETHTPKDKDEKQKQKKCGCKNEFMYDINELFFREISESIS